MAVTAADLDALIAADLARRADAHQLRSRRPLVPISSTHVRIDGREYVNFASNNYLGLTHHPRLLNAAQESLRAKGLGSGAAALITGYTDTHAHAERQIAHWKGTESAVLLPSGYQANHAAVQTLAALGERQGGVRFLIDKLSHASLLDAVRGASAEFRVFPHNHLGKLERLLSDAPSGELQVVLTESIFSMDGNAADLAGLAALKRRYPFFLLLDEAHGSGVYGDGGAGYATEMGRQDVVDASVVTLSKALGSIGGAVCASANFCAALVNYGRAYIYSTGVPAWMASAAVEAIGVLRDEPERQMRVRLLAKRVREAVGATGSDSPIVPVLLGDEGRTLAASQRLLEAGFLVPAVRPPTVPKGGSRLRVTLCCDHLDDEVSKLLDMLARIRTG